LVTKSAIRPGSNFNRQGGSIFHQRQHVTPWQALALPFTALRGGFFCRHYIRYSPAPHAERALSDKVARFMTGHIRSLPLTRGETTIKNARADTYESSPQALLCPVTKHLQVTHVSLLPKVVHRALGLEQNFFHNRLIYNN
ncbi:hypothetical protein V1958_31580, partial [Pseudomonas aeruginosa]